MTTSKKGNNWFSKVTFENDEDGGRTEDELEEEYFDAIDKSGHIEELLSKTKQTERDKIENMKKLKNIREETKEKQKKEENKIEYDRNREVIKKGGNFEIQVNIIECRKLKGKDWNNTSDPRASITIFDKILTTKSLNDTRNPYWNQILYFNFNLQPNELNKGKCLIKILDADINADDLIGIFVFDLSWIYYKKHHQIYKQWVALTNNEQTDVVEQEGNDGIEGYLKCSISILGPNDEQYINNDDEYNDIYLKQNELQNGMILMSPTIIQSPHLLTVRIHKMKYLANTDKESIFESIRHSLNNAFDEDKTNTIKLDPFLYVEYGGTRIRSLRLYEADDINDCLVQTQFEIPVIEPVFSSNITITAMDWDLMSRNDRIGCINIDYTELKTDKYWNKINKIWYIPPRWYYIYGAPIGKQRGYARKMNKGLVEGSHFRGQILLELSLKKTKFKKSCNVKDIDYDKKEEFIINPDIQLIDYYLRCDLFQGTEINDIIGISSGKINVKISIANYTAKSTTKQISKNNSFIEWYETLTSENNKKTKNKLIGPFKIAKNWQSDKNIELPSIFIYLCIEDVTSSNTVPVSYYKIPLRQILPKHGREEMLSRPPIWYDMKPNLAANKYNNNISVGSLLIGLNAGPLPIYNNKDDDDDDDDEKKQDEMKEMESINGQKKKTKFANVIIEIIEASNLPQLDPNGFSDPYVKIKIGDKIQRSEIMEKTLYPKWNRQPLEFRNVEIGEMMILEIWDYDFWGSDEHGSSINPIKLIGEQRNDEWIDLNISEYAKNKYPENDKLCEHSQIKIAIHYEFLDDNKIVKTPKLVKKCSYGLLNIFSIKHKTEDIAHLDGPTKKKMQLRTHVYQAKNLQNKDISGLSDAYLVVRFCGEEARTQTIDNHIDPKWFKTLILEETLNVPFDENIESNPLHLAPRICCEIYDYDYLQKDELLGRFTVDASKIFIDIKNNNKYAGKLKPKWYDLEDCNHQQVDGKVLIAFELFADNYKSISLPNKLIPNPVIRWMHIITLGLRDLQSTFGVNKPLIEFEINGIIYKTEASNVPSSRNPNFNQILHFPVELPESMGNDEIFLPNLNLTIKDSLCGGAIKRQIGYASQNIAQFINVIEIEKEPLESKQKNESISYVAHHHHYDSKQTEEEDDGKDDGKDDEKTGLLSNNNVIKYDTMKKKKKGGINNKLNLLTLSRRSERKIEYEVDYNTFDWNMKYDGKKEKEKYKMDRIELKEESELLEWERSLSGFKRINLFKGRNKQNCIGYFKGLISITNTRESLLDNEFLIDITKPIELYLRLYILKGKKLNPKDDDGLSDPYLIVKIGDKEISTRDRYLSNTVNPGFYESFEIAVILPGPSNLQIEVWDYDGIGDDLIGKTYIDIEDRYYSEEWRNIKLKPIETRILRLDESNRDQGKLTMWMELLSIQERKRNPKMIDIKPDEPCLYELRVIIWECSNVEYHDKQTNANDLYISGTLRSPQHKEEEDTQETDLHFRSRNGKGSFNWRMKYSLKLPKESDDNYPRFMLQIWDKDYFSPNDNISELIIGLRPFLQFCEMNSFDKRCRIIKKGQDKFWVDFEEKHNLIDSTMQLIGINKKGKGRVKISMELVPEQHISRYPAGIGRNKPNVHPTLPPPIGRQQFSIFHPFDGLRRILGDQLCCKICCLFICLICICFVIFILPNLVSAIIANIVS